MTDRKMLLGMQLGTTYGSQATAWRAPNVSRGTYTEFDAYVRYAQAAERGKFQFLFLPVLFPKLSPRGLREGSRKGDDGPIWRPDSPWTDPSGVMSPTLRMADWRHLGSTNTPRGGVHGD